MHEVLGTVNHCPSMRSCKARFAIQREVCSAPSLYLCGHAERCWYASQMLNAMNSAAHGVPQDGVKIRNTGMHRALSVFDVHAQL